MTGAWRAAKAHPRLSSGAMLAVAAVVSTILTEPGALLADGRYEHFADPVQFLQRHSALWDDSRGPGNPTPYFSPVTTAVQAALAFLSVPAWLIGRLTLACYLTVAGVGATALTTRLAPGRVGVACMAGALYAFNPFTSQFLVPSGVFLPAALLPWMLASGIDGCRGPDRIRPAARLALLVFSIGVLNTAAVVYVAVPLVAFLAALALVDRDVSLRDVMQWLWRAAVAVTAVSAAMLVVLGYSLPMVERNLSTTELPSTVAGGSSAAESWRGLGLWLTTFRWFDGYHRPQAASYYTSPIVLVTSYLTLGLAFVGGFVAKFPKRATLLLLTAGSVLVMVGGHQPEWSPFSALHAAVMEHVVGARALRTTYKIGAMPTLAVAILAAGGISHLWHSGAAWSGRRPALGRLRRGVVGIAVCCAAVVSAYPFVTGQLVSAEDTLETVPSYWTEAFEWFDNVDANDRVLVLPGVARARYVWGFVNDNLFDAHLTPQLMMAQTLTPGTASVAAATEAVDRWLGDSAADPAAVAPVLRWLDVQWVVVQNDLLADSDIPTTDDFDDLRQAPGIVKVATFGTIDGRPAVEVFRVDRSEVRPEYLDAPPAIVSGGPDAAPTLAGYGWLDGHTTLLAALDETQLADLVDAGAPVVVTDGAQRRAIRSQIEGALRSYVLGTEGDLDRPIDTPSSDPATQTVATYGAIDQLRSTPADGTGLGWGPAGRPANAFDGDPQTAWYVSLLEVAEGASIDATFSEGQTVADIVIEPFQSGGRSIGELAVTLTTPDGGSTTTLHRITDGGAPVRLKVDAEVTALAIELSGVTDGFGGVGLREVIIHGPGGRLDTTEWLRTPTEIQRLTDPPPGGVAYVFGRIHGEETALRREFVVQGRDRFDVEARLAPELAPFVMTCIPLLEIDGEPIEVRASGERDEHGIVVRACEDVILDRGTHRLQESAPFRGRVDHVQLAAGLVQRNGDVRIVETEYSDSYETPIPLEAHDGFLLSTLPAHAGWSLTASNRSLTSLSIDGRAAWHVAAGDPTVATLRFTPQATYQVALLVTSLAVLGCVALLVRRPRAPAAGGVTDDNTRPAMPAMHDGRSSLGIRVAGLAAAACLGGFVAGFPGAASAIALAVADRIAPRLCRCAVGVLGVGMVVAVLVEDSLTGPWAHFAERRPVSHVIGLILIIGVAVAGYGERPVGGRRRGLTRGDAASACRPIGPQARPILLLRLATAGAIATFALAAMVSAVHGPISRQSVVVAGAVVTSAILVVRGTPIGARVRSVITGADGVVIGSTWLLASTAIVSVGSFLFWLLAARHVDEAAVGRGSALFSSAMFLTYATGLGLPTAVTRFAGGQSAAATSLFVWSIAATIASSVVGVMLFAALAPARTIAPLGPFAIAVLAAIVASLSISVLVDARLTAQRRWAAVFWRTIAITVIRLAAFAVIPTTDSGRWIFVVCAGAYGMSGVLLLPVALRGSGGWASRRRTGTHVDRFVRYAGINYLGQLAVQAPFYLTPLVVSLSVSSGDNGRFYLAWGIATVVMVGVQVIAQSMLAEGSQRESDRARQVRVGFVVALTITVVAATGAVLLSGTVARVFGRGFLPVATHLRLLIPGCIPWAFTMIALTSARLSLDKRRTVLISVPYAVCVVGGVTIGVLTGGVTGASVGWFIGNYFSLVTSLWPVLEAVRSVPSDGYARVN